jgi:GTP-binding protein
MSSIPNKPFVAIIGRPNVGKSSLFNKLTRSRRALVRNEPGVTRDLLIEPTAWWGFEFNLMDTGGITEGKEGFSPMIREQVLNSLNRATGLVVVVDAKIGLVPEDRDMIRIAKESGKPFCIVANKIDNPLQAEMLTAEFFEFGMDVIAAGFERDFGVDEVVEWIKANCDMVVEQEEDPTIRLSLIGKPNAGKSSLCNLLLGRDRMLVSEIAGTTSDTVADRFERGGSVFEIVDTAGLRRNSKRNEGVERLSAHKSYNALKKSDIVLVLIDAIEGVSVSEAKFVEMCVEEHKAVILVFNKVDLAQQQIAAYRETLKADIQKQFHFFPDIPVEFVSAKTGKGLDRLFKRIEDLNEKLHARIPTSKLNQFFADVIRLAPAPVYGVKDVKFYYLTQTSQSPPSFIAFANQPKGVTPAYRRFLSKRIAGEFGLEGVPIRMFVMSRRR